MYKSYSPICYQEQGAETAGGQPVGASTRHVGDVGGGDHRAFALGCVAIRDAVEEPPLPTSQESPVAVARLDALASRSLGRDNGHHSKPSEACKNADLSQRIFFRDLVGFSSLYRFADPGHP
jgi:hypothetical protein